ncbi:MAG: hypothetical protein H6658_16530 [Ardenticatenaceae bacterium]|nr:hypothetical protein [Ardenticatenaceae bacterium]
MKHLLLLGLLFLTACTFVSEPIAVTRIVVATAVPPTTMPTATSLSPTATATTAVYPTISLTETIPFTHTKHGYTIQYPVGFYSSTPDLDIESDTLLATHPNAEDHVAPLSYQDFWIVIRVMENPDGLSLDQWADSQLLPRGTQQLTVDGVLAWQGSGIAAPGTGHDIFSIATYVVQDDHVFTMIGFAPTADTLLHYTPVYQSLLATFRFLP